MQTRVELLRSLGNGSLTGRPAQVVVATQSVDFLNHVELDELRIIERTEEGGCQVHRVDQTRTVAELVSEFSAATGDLWFSGLLGGV